MSVVGADVGVGSMDVWSTGVACVDGLARWQG